jgi:hypothetical protein
MGNLFLRVFHRQMSPHIHIHFRLRLRRHRRRRQHRSIPNSCLTVRVWTPLSTELIKDLHAYAIASLRALDNYRQSIIEARQDRSARMAGIDQRVARIELELP